MFGVFDKIALQKINEFHVIEISLCSQDRKAKSFKKVYKLVKFISLDSQKRFFTHINIVNIDI